MNTNDKASVDRDSVVQIGKDARADLHSAIDQAAEKAQPMVDRLASSAHEGVDQISAKLNDVSGTLAERGKQVGDAYHRFADTGRGYVRSSPAVSLLVALAAGYGLSKLIGARK